MTSTSTIETTQNSNLSVLHYAGRSAAPIIHSPPTGLALVGVVVILAAGFGLGWQPAR